MTVDELQKFLLGVSYPNATFLAHDLGTHINLHVNLKVIDVNTGQEGWITTAEEYNLQAIASWDRYLATEHVWLLVQNICTHEMCEQFRVGNDRPKDPHKREHGYLALKEEDNGLAKT